MGAAKPGPRRIRVSALPSFFCFSSSVFFLLNHFIFSIFPCSFLKDKLRTISTKRRFPAEKPTLNVKIKKLSWIRLFWKWSEPFPIFHSDYSSFYRCKFPKKLRLIFSLLYQFFLMPYVCITLHGCLFFTLKYSSNDQR